MKSFYGNKNPNFLFIINGKQNIFLPILLTTIFLFSLFNLRILYANVPELSGNGNNPPQERSNLQTQVDNSQTDNIAPVIEPIEPDSNAIDVARDTHIQVGLTDSVSGLDLETFFLKVDDEDVTGKVMNFGDLSDMTFTYNSKHQTLFGYNQTVWVHVHVADRAGNVSDLIYKFTTEKERQSPIIEFIYPKNNDSDVPLEVKPKFNVTDELSGINLNSLLVSVSANGRDLPFEAETTALPDGYQLELTPSTKFNYNDTVKIYVYIEDNSENATENSCHFYIQTDTESPVIEFIKPPKNEREVDRHTTIEIETFDTLSGINPDSIKISLQVNDAVDYRSLDIIQNPIAKGYRILLNPAAFQYNDKVSVFATVYDSAGNQFSDVCNFWIQVDTTAPELSPFYPSASEDSVKVDSDIRVKATDTQSGVEEVLMWVKFDGIDWEQVALSTSDSIFTYENSRKLGYNSQIDVKCVASDSTGNKSDTLRYYFTTEDSLSGVNNPPVIIAVSPKEDEENVPLDATIRIDITDDTGVDVNSISVQVGLKLVTDSCEIDSSDLKHIKITYQPPVAFNYNDTVHVIAIASDIPGKGTDKQYRFMIERDDTPPSITFIDPEKNETDVKPTITPIIEITDSLSGVDTSTITFELKVNGVPDNRELTLEITSLADQNGYRYTLEPSTDFAPGDTVLLSVYAEDRVGNPGFDRCEFIIGMPVDDKTPPWVDNLYPAHGAPGIPLDTLISFNIKDDISGINLNSVKLELDYARNGEGFFQADYTSEMQESSLNYRIRFKPEWPRHLYYNDTVRVRIEAMDQNNNVMEPHESIFYTEVDTTAPVLSTIYPRETQDSVSIDSDIKLKVTDTQSGVKEVLMWVKFDGIIWQQIALSASGSIFTFENSRTFRHSSQIDVKCVAYDSVGNMSEILAYYFTTEDSLSGVNNPPDIIAVSPKEDENNVPVDEAIRIDITDDIGVDVNSISVQVDSRDVTDSYEIDDRDPKHIEITYQPPVAFDYNDTIYVIVVASDISGKTSDKQYKFITERDGDDTPPEVELIRPDSMEDVARETDILLRVKDDKSGVNENSTKMWLSINDEDLDSLVHIEQTDSLGYLYVFYEHQEDFWYGDTVRVKFHVEDRAGNAADPVYTFTVEDDTIKPTIVYVAPEGISPKDATVIVEVFDYESGINLDSTFMVVGSDTARFDSSTANPLENGWRLVYNAERNTIFESNSIVPVYLNAFDNRNNFTVLDTLFMIEPGDILPPWIDELISPKSDTVELNSLIYQFAFNIKDNLSGVDTSSIEVTIKHDFVVYGISDTSESVKFGDPDGNELEITKSDPNDLGLAYDISCAINGGFHFQYNEMILMIVNAKDNVGNAMVDTITFFSIQDREPPIIVEKKPIDVTEVDTSECSDISIVLKDLVSGIDADSIGMWIEVSPIDSEEPKTWDPNGELMKNGKAQVTLTADLKKATLKLIGSCDVDYNKRVRIHIEAQDLVEPKANKLDTTIHFDTKTIRPDLTVEACDASGKRFTIDDSVTVTAMVKNMNARVVNAFSVRFEAEEGMDPVEVPVTTPLEKGETLPVSTRLLFKCQGTLVMTIIADFYNQIWEEDESNNELTLEVLVGGVDGVAVRSNPFTPNGDGINDNAYFFCEKFLLENPYIKIFDLRGRSVRELNPGDISEYQEGEKKFKWDGRCDNGQELIPGLYLFMLKDKGKNLASGGVVIAR